jgi:PAS domain S-box-containing protein
MDKNQRADHAPLSTSGSGSTGSSIGESEPSVITVLYIDDEPALLEPTKISLEKKKGFFVDTTMSATDALGMIAARSYDVIVSDYQMPEMDGIQLLRKLREENNDIPFIIFTGRGREEVVIEAYNAGADFYLAKGGNPRAMIMDLANKIRQTVNRKRAEKALRESEERYRKVVEQSHDAIYIYQGKKFVFANDRVCEISGYSKDELYGMNILDLVHPDDRDRVGEIARKRQSGGDAPETYEARILTKKGETRYLEFSMASLIFNGSNAAQGSVRDITDRKKAEEELRSSEQYLKTIFNSVQTGLVIIDPGTFTIIDANPAAIRLIGTNRDAIIGADGKNFISPSVKRGDYVTGNPPEQENVEGILTRADGQKVPIQISIIPVTISGKPAFLESILDITDRKRAEDAMQKAYFELEQKVEERTKELSQLTLDLQGEITRRNRVLEALAASEEKYRSLVEQIGDIVFHIDENGFITYMSPHVLTNMGMTQDNLGKIHARDLAPPEYREAIRKYLDPSLSEYPQVSGFEINVPKSSAGSPLVFEVNATPSYDRTGRFTGYSGIARDITVRKNLENEIASSLNEKEILLKEIHHRVKNNMQVISSLLSLQARLMKDPEGREAIRESQNRVMSIALVHEKLYQSKNLARIHYDEYLRRIGENLLQSYGIPAGKIRLDIHAEDLVLPISKAIPISLIINEMLSNALKYAFPDKRTGTITIDFKRAGDHYTLVVKDDGIGLPARIVLESIDTLGLQLVNSLVAQIQGTLSLQRENGTEYRMEFDFEPEEGDHYG